VFKFHSIWCLVDHESRLGRKGRNFGQEQTSGRTPEASHQYDQLSVGQANRLSQVIHYFAHNLLIVHWIGPFLLCWLHNFIGNTLPPVGKCVLYFLALWLSGVLNLGYRLILTKNFIWLPFTWASQPGGFIGSLPYSREHHARPANGSGHCRRRW
jgi:hypothetical protein